MRPGQVVLIHDDLVDPPKPKFVIAICPEHALFVRINSKPCWAGSIPLSRSDAEFLDHDSFIECGTLLELDDYIVSKSERRGLLGTIHSDALKAVMNALLENPMLNEDQRKATHTAVEAEIGLRKQELAQRLRNRR